MGRQDEGNKLLNIFGLSNIIKKRDNVINSLNGKVKYLKDKLEDKE